MSNIEAIPIPEGFSIELPNYGLVFGVSPFPVVRCLMLKEAPLDYALDDDHVWVQLKSNLVGLFRRSDFKRAQVCPTCGRELARNE